MTTYFNQPCPLCSNQARYYWVDRDNRKYFHCLQCTYFQISRRAEEVLAGKSPQRRQSYADAAKRGTDEQIFVILMATADQQRATNDDLHASFVAKTELPLRGN